MNPKFTNCVVCNSNDLRKLYDTFDRHYGNTAIMFEVDKCDRCGLLFLNPMITDTELHSMYNEDSYYAYKAYDTVAEDLGLVKKLYRGLTRIKPRDPRFDPKGKKILDIGCGSGKELFEYKKEGGDVSGVEISKGGAEFGNTLGLNIFNGTLLAAKFPSDTFHYVRSNHSFEHLVNPVETAHEMFRITKPGGVLFVGVPNTGSLPYRLFGKYWYYLGVPFHPFNYNPTNMRELFLSTGFKLQKVQYNGDFHGVVGSFQIWLNRNNGKTSHTGFFINSSLFKVISHQIAKVFNFLSAGDCMELIFEKPGAPNTLGK